MKLSSKKETLVRYFRIKKNKFPITPRHTQSITSILNQLNYENNDNDRICNTTFRKQNKKPLYFEKVDEIKEYKERMKRLKENINPKLKITNSKKDKVVKIVQEALTQKKKNFHSNFYSSTIIA